jgi:hypothetical protein
MQSRKLLAAALAVGLLGVAVACGGKTATAVPTVSPGDVDSSDHSLEELLKEVDLLLTGGSLRSPDFIRSPLGDLKLPDLDVAVPAGAVSGLDTEFDWRFEVPEVEIAAPTISPGDLTPGMGFGRP